MMMVHGDIKELIKASSEIFTADDLEIAAIVYKRKSTGISWACFGDDVPLVGATSLLADTIKCCVVRSYIDQSTTIVESPKEAPDGAE